MYINKLPEELINYIYRIIYSDFINGVEFRNKLFAIQLRRMSFRQRRHITAYINDAAPTAL